MWFLAPLVIGIGAALFPKSAQSSLTAIKSTAKEIFGPFLTFGPPTKNSIDIHAFALAKQKVIAAEGRRNDVYRDSRGKLTVGIGHLVTAADGLVFGDRITDARVDQLFEIDIEEAFEAAKKQAIELKRYRADFIAALTSVNFQLGTGWPKVFYNTYALLKQGDYQTAIYNLNQSAWRQQTPVRVAEFVYAIETAYA